MMLYNVTNDQDQLFH